MEHIYSSLSLAYIGDSVYDLYIRGKILENGDKRVKELHKISKSYVSAKAQNEIVHKIMENFTEEELAIYKRGRNTKVNTKAKNACMAEYHSATGLEALIGYLYLDGRHDRLKEVLDMCFNAVE